MNKLCSKIIFIIIINHPFYRFNFNLRAFFKIIFKAQMQVNSTLNKENTLFFNYDIKKYLQSDYN